MEEFDNISKEENTEEGSGQAADMLSDIPVPDTPPQQGQPPYAGMENRPPYEYRNPYGGSGAAPYLNREGGIFSERDFAEGIPQNAPGEAYQRYGNYLPRGNPADGAYRQMYAYNQPSHEQGYAPYNNGQPQGYAPYPNGQPQGNMPYQNGQPQGYAAYQNSQPYQGQPRQEYGSAYGERPVQDYSNTPYRSYQSYQGGQHYSQPVRGNYYARPAVEEVSPLQTAPVKKSSKAWIIISVILIVLLIVGLMLALAFSHKGEKTGEKPAEISSSLSDSPSNVTVNISTVPKPVEDDSFYQNKETGLLTPAGAAHQVLPSVLNVYGYSSTALIPSKEASGIIISEDGYIITNAHAVEDISRFKVKLHDEREFEAKLIGSDPRSDLAVLKIEADGLVPAVIGKSGDMLQGEQVIAIGNANGFSDTVTVGSVSYVNRQVKSYTGYPMDCIQTDAAINYGNSGGALVNLYGQVVGIIVSKSAVEGTENIGFCIASDFAVPVLEDIIEKGYVTGRPKIGIVFTYISPERADAIGIKPGLLISEVDPSCDIANTDLQKDDVITAIDGVDIISSNFVKEFQISHKAGDVVTAKVYRKTLAGDESEFEITFRLGEMQ